MAQGTIVDPEELGRPLLDLLRPARERQEDPLLVLFEFAVEVDRIVGGRDFGGAGAQDVPLAGLWRGVDGACMALPREISRQVVLRSRLPIAKSDGVFDDVFEFADVSRVLVLEQNPAGFDRETIDSSFVGLGELPQEKPYQ